MAETNIALEVFGMITSLLLLLCCVVEVPASKKQNTLFIAMLAINFAVLGCDALTWVLEERAEFTAFLYLLNFLVYSLGYVLTALFSWYFYAYLPVKTKSLRRLARAINVFCTFAIVLVVVSLFNHMYFSFEGGVYERGDWFWLSQFYPIVLMLVNLFVVFRYHAVLGLHDTLSFLSYEILPILAMGIQIYVYGITLLYLATTVSLEIVYIMVHMEQNRRAERQRTELVQANTAIMLSQIQPHFLYNSLASIAYLCDSDPQRAKEATVEFSRYLRGNIDAIQQTAPVPFSTELEHIQTYLKLEKMRFQDDLNLVYDVGTTDFSVPSLTIQPLVENAVKYGVGQKEGGGTVTLSTEELSDCVKVRIADDGVGYDPNEPKQDGRSHVGIENVRSRLATQCNATLTIESVKGVGTIVTVTLPKERERADSSGR